MQYAKVSPSELCTPDVLTSALLQNEIERSFNYHEDLCEVSNIDIFFYSVYVKIIEYYIEMIAFTCIYRYIMKIGEEVPDGCKL